MNVAYIRVSSVDQNEARQIEALKKYNIEKTFIEKVSGKNMEREQLQAMLDFVREGDTVYIKDFSRLSRSVADLLKIIDMLKDKGVHLVSDKEALDTNTPTGKLMLTMIAAINEFERMNIIERQREGIEIAKRQGVYKGRRPKEYENFAEVYSSWKNGEITATGASKILGMTRQNFYRRAKLFAESCSGFDGKNQSVLEM